jgi:hypothetical protein
VRLSGLLESRRHVDRVAGRQRVALAGNDLAGVETDPARQANAPVALELPVELLEPGDHVRRRPYGPQRVVLVHHRDAEDGHDRVADELLDGAAVTFDRRAHGVEVAAHHASGRFGVEPLAHRGRARDVAEQHRHGLSNLARRRTHGEWGAARAAEPEAVRALVPAALTPRHRADLRVMHGRHLTDADMMS